MDNLDAQSCHSPDTDDNHWSQIKFTSIKPQQHVCLRARLRVNDNNRPENPSLFVAALAAYDIHLNGEFLGSNGVPGDSVESEQTGPISCIVSLGTGQIATGEHLLTLEMSSFKADASFAGVAYLIAITDRQSLADTVLTVNLIAAGLIGGLWMLFTIFMVLYWQFKRESSYLIFAVLCMFTGLLLVAEQWKLWVSYHYDVHLVRLQIIIVLTCLVTSLLPGYYLWQHYIANKRLWFLALLTSLDGAMLLTQSYDERSEWLFIVSLTFVVVLNLIAIHLKKPFAVTSLLIAVISLLAVLLVPRLFLELGFGLAICLVLASIGLSLIKQLRLQRDKALLTGRVRGELLRRNLQPHYLMNCLMQIQELIDLAPQQANEFVAELAEEFRALVTMSERSVVTLKDEVTLCEHHLKIMSIRYQQRYQLCVEIPDNGISTSLMIPSAIVHSQIENCFTHNRISEEQQLMLSVTEINDRTFLELKTPVSAAINHRGLGIGEAYIRAKMEEVCEPGWQLECFESEGAWVTKYQYKLKAGSNALTMEETRL